MKLTGIEGGLVSCACWEDHITLKWQKCGFLVILLSSSIGASLLFPYLIVTIRGLMPPFMPLISNAGGLPPANGVFAVFLILSGFFGFVTFPLFFETINHRNFQNRKILLKLNKLGGVIALVVCFGFVLTACYPVGYTDVPNMFEWVVTVLFEHSIGATMVLFGTAFYQFVLGGIWWLLLDTSKCDKYVKLGFIVVYILFFFITVYPLPAYVIEQFGPNLLDFARFKTTSYSLPVVYTTNFVICSVCEYAIGILSIANFMTLFKDLQRVSLSIVLRPRSCVAEEDPLVPSIQLKIFS
ncbi:hypothetical protein JTE90_026431 [Oedothorax gibbosus]|uniref:Uncharacterized protein n=1 Tax=Oedothorax gibbosus TaxID=931172 RepID=A0AAV6VRY9_9ARAC|nr:hypothetical protein JTE90_026431 [Oedothorax gibbosus]